MTEQRKTTKKRATRKKRAPVPGKQLTLTERVAAALPIAQTESQLVALSKVSEEITEIRDNAGDQQANRARIVLKNTRLAIEHQAKDALVDAKAFVKAVGERQKFFVGIIQPEEQRLKGLQDAWVKAEEEREEEEARIEAERIAKIREAIGKIRGVADGVGSLNTNDIEVCLNVLEEIEEEGFERFDEFEEQARQAFLETNEFITAALENRWQFDLEQAEARKIAEENKRQAEELERQRQELAEQQRKLDEERRQRDEEARKAQDEADAAVRKAQEEQERIEREKREAEEAAAKAEKEAQEAAEREERERQEAIERANLRAALRPDREKLEEWAGRLKNDEGPDVLASTQAQNIRDDAMAQVGDIGNMILERARTLGD